MGRTLVVKTFATISVIVYLSAASFCQNPAPTFSKDVALILQKHCQTCHRPGEAAPFPLLTYEQTRSWAASMKLMVKQKQMPPWFADPAFGHFSNDRSLTSHELPRLPW